MSEINTVINDRNLDPNAAPMDEEVRPLPTHSDDDGMEQNFRTPWKRTRPELDSQGPLTIEAGPDTKVRLAAIMAADNPLLEAAQTLLRTLADMPAQLDDQEPGIESLRELLIREVQIYQTLCDQANLRREHVLAVRFCLCTALDEAASKTVWGRGGAWASKSLLIVYHGENDGGEKIFLLIGRLSSDPQEHGQVLEVIYRLLGLGFEGRYSVRADGRKQLDLIRQQLLAIISSQRDAVARTLSPHWQSVVSGRLPLLRWLPVWASACLFVLLLSAAFIWYKYHILDNDAALQERIAAIGKVVPPPGDSRVLRLKVLLKDEIEGGMVKVDEDVQQSRVTFLGDLMFVPGQKIINPTIMPVLDKVAGEINRVTGSVTITGHTDNHPIHTAEFPNNQVLSEKRAAGVADVLIAKGVATSRIQTLGKGDSEPVEDNTSKAGRAKNRRVDIVVTE